MPTSRLEFALTAPTLSYRFHVDPNSKELVHDHYGGPATEHLPGYDDKLSGHQPLISRQARELPDLGRGDFRLPAIHLRHTAGHTVTALKYVSHEIIPGKPALPGLPSTFGGEDDVQSLRVVLRDQLSGVVAELLYSVFPECSAVTRSVTLRNEGTAEVEIERLASWSGEMPVGEWEMVQLCGDWGREAQVVRRPIHYGMQGFQSAAGYSSHFHNPFVALVSPDTSEASGPAYGFNLIYTGSHAVEVERFSHDSTRVLLGLNPLHLSWELAPGESFTTPECVSVYSEQGLGGMSRCLHRLYRKHLSRSKWTMRTRPCLLNNWEATYFDFDAAKLYEIADKAADLGVRLFVMDDGWFGIKHARTDDRRGLGDWVPNPDRFPQGLKPFVDRVNGLKVKGEPLRFGIWVEPEMVSPLSELYEAHSDWVLHAGEHERTTGRYELVLNVGLKAVQDYIIDAISTLLSSAKIGYVKWDNNRCMHELPSPSAAHAYMLGLYRVLETLTTRFPDVLWEGCASGGGRFDPGLLHYFPQTWTSDNTDAHDRLAIQFGTSLAYPPSAMGCHVSAVPNHQTHRTTPLAFRAHVAMMGGSFGFELDPTALTPEEQAAVPSLIKLSEKVNPFVIQGDLYRLAMPQQSNWPAAMYVMPDGSEAVVLAYQVQHVIKRAAPALRLQGLGAEAVYEVEDGEERRRLSGATLMNTGLQLWWEGDYQSRVIFVTKFGPHE